jgi:hypothetical protein
MGLPVKPPTGRCPIPGMVIQRLAAALVACAVLTPSVSAVTLGISPDGRFFTLDGTPTYLNGVSYYAAQSISTPSFITQDLDDMVAAGFNWIRVWANWSVGYPDHNENVSVFSVGGAVREPYMSRFKTLITECNQRGIVVDCTFDHASAGTVAQHQAAVQMVAQQLLPYRNVYIDVGNERDVGDARYLSLPECGTLITAVKAIDPQRICTASSVPGSQSELNDFRTIAEMDFIAPHLCRDAGCSAQTLGTVRQYISWMHTLGFRMPIHLQEPFRRGYTTYNPIVDDFWRDDSGARIAEAAGWCFHNGSDRGSADGRPRRSFDMSNTEGRLFSQFDSVEQTVSTSLNDVIAGTNVKIRRYQVEYLEQVVHLVGRREDSAWSADVAQDAAGYLTQGPSINTVPVGQHTVTWRLQIDNNSVDNAAVLTIDVARNAGGTILASRQIRRQDFTLPGVWQEFSLAFSSNPGDVLEFRTYWLDQAKISLDWITLAIDGAPVNQPPVIVEVAPDPDIATSGQEYVRQLTLQQGSVPITWSVVQAPAGANVGVGGLVTGWTPGPGGIGTVAAFSITATNAQGSDTESWQVQVLSQADFDRDGDVDQADFGHFQQCISGLGVGYDPGCKDADLDGNGDVGAEDFNLFFPCVGGPNARPGC